MEEEVSDTVWDSEEDAALLALQWNIDNPAASVTAEVTARIGVGA